MTTTHVQESAAVPHLALGLNGNLDDGIREVHALKDDGALLITQSLTCVQAIKVQGWGRLVRVRVHGADRVVSRLCSASRLRFQGV